MAQGCSLSIDLLLNVEEVGSGVQLNNGRALEVCFLQMTLWVYVIQVRICRSLLTWFISFVIGGG